MKRASRVVAHFFAVVMSLSCGARLQGETNAVVVPNTPAGRQFSQWLKTFNTGDVKLISSFVSAHFVAPALARIPADDRAVQDTLIFKENQGLELRRVAESTEHRLTAVTQSKLSGLWFRVTTEVEQTAPHGITDLRIRFMPTPDDVLPLRSLSDAERAAELGRYVEQLSQADVFSGVVLVAHKSKPFLRQAYGQADKSINAPNRLETKFNLASMNKMFTAVAIAQLAQQGKLKFTDKLEDHLPGYPNKAVAGKVTLHQLLTHTSGLGSYWNERYEARKDTVRKVSDFLPFFVDEPLSFEPGARFEYSNSGYIVLGLIIEQVSGQDYYDYIQEHICKAAGMTDTAFYESDQKVADLAIGYTNFGPHGPFLGERKANSEILGRRGASAGGGYSTADDLLKFGIALRSNKLLNADYTNLVLEGKVERDELTRYAYGFEERRVKGQRVVGHGGGFPGVSTQLEMYLETDYTVVVLTNVDNLGMLAVATKARELLTGTQNVGARDVAFEKKVDVGGRGLHISCSAKPNKEGPTVVLEAGLTQGSEAWDKVQPAVATFSRVCSYDRAGIGKSDAPPPEQAITSQQIVEDLHRLLETAGIVPPLVLVGHSFGGANVRLYASLYPKEVVGMVLVDSVHEEESEKWLAMLPTETRKQMEAAGGRRLLGSVGVDLETSLKQLKAAGWRTEIPLIVLARGTASFDPNDYPPQLRSLAPKGEQLRIEMQKDLATRSARSTFQFAEKSGHLVQQDEPDLVVDAIRRVVESTRSGDTKKAPTATRER